MVQLFLAFPGQVPLRSAAFAELTEPGVTDHLWPACSPAGLALSLAQKLREGRDLVFWGRRTVSGDDPRFADRGFHPRVPLHFPLLGLRGHEGGARPSLKLAKALLRTSVRLSVATSSLHVRPLGGDLWSSVPQDRPLTGPRCGKSVCLSVCASSPRSLKMRLLRRGFRLMDVTDYKTRSHVIVSSLPQSFTIVPVFIPRTYRQAYLLFL